MSKKTWKVRKCGIGCHRHIETEDGTQIGTVNIRGESEEFVHLVKAAPALLAACETVRKFLLCHAPECRYRALDACPLCTCGLLEAREQLKDAIATATPPTQEPQP